MFCVVLRLDCHHFDLVTSVGMLANVCDGVSLHKHVGCRFVLKTCLMIPTVSLLSCVSHDAVHL